MKQAALLNFDLTWIPVTGLVLFVASFVLYTWWTWREKNSAHYQEASVVPLNDLSPVKTSGQGNGNEH